MAAYAAVSAANQMLWLTFAPVTTEAARHYGVSVGSIGWLAQIFPLLYVVLALPAGRLIDRRLPLWLGVGAVLTAAGALLRLAGDVYPVALAGQLLIAVAQPLVLNSVTKLSRSYLLPRDRPTGIAISSAGIFGGMVLAFTTGAVIGGARLTELLAVQAVLAVAAAAALCWMLRSPGVQDGRSGVADTPAAQAVPLRTVWGDHYIRILVALVLVGFGVFVALTTWLQALLEPAGISEADAGLLLLVMVVAGVVGSALLPARLVRHGTEGAFLLLSVCLGALGCLVLAVHPSMATALPVLAIIGALLLTDLPIILELAERRAGSAGGTATGLLWLAGNLGGLLLALLVQVLVHRPTAAFVVLAVSLAAGLPVVLLLRRAGTGSSTPDGAPRPS